MFGKLAVNILVDMTQFALCIDFYIRHGLSPLRFVEFLTTKPLAIYSLSHIHNDYTTPPVQKQPFFGVKIGLKPYKF